MGPEKIILAVRSVEKGEEARKSVLATAQNSETIIEVWQLDLSSFKSVISFADRMKKDLKRLDILLGNAGMISAEWKTTSDGHEIGVQTNVLSTFLLAILSLPLLRHTAKMGPPVKDSNLKPHLVIVASDRHTVAKFSQKNQPNVFKALDDESLYEPKDRYATTKLLDVLLTREMGSLLQNDDFVVCSVNPGLCGTELARDWPIMVRYIFYTLLGKTAAEGVKNYTWASIQSDIPPGSYVSSCRVEEMSTFADSPAGFALQKQLWSEMMEILSKESPELGGVLGTT